MIYDKIYSWFITEYKHSLTHIGKDKVHTTIGNEGPEVEYMYISTLSLTSALNGVGGQRHAPAALPPRKNPVPAVEEGRSGRMWKISPPPGFDPRIVRPIAQPLYRLRYLCIHIYV